MRLFDKDKEKKMKEQMPTVIENEYFKLETKDGRKIESANIAISVDGVEQGLSAIAGNVETAFFRTAEALLSFGLVATNQVNDADFGKAGMIAVLEAAIELFDEAVAEKETEEDGTIRFDVGRRG